MYTPTSFAVSDPQRLQQALEEYSFATLISVGDDAGLSATHLPLLLDPSPHFPGRLLGHMAKANSHWRSASGKQVLAIFHGPHTYISPTWYAEPRAVPTWNYVAVHVHGSFHLVEDRDRTLEILHRMVDFLEAPLPQPWSIAQEDPDLIEGLLDQIVAFEIAIERIEGKWKLNQNQSELRRDRVINQLQGAASENARQIAALMEERRREEGPATAPET